MSKLNSLSSSNNESTKSTNSNSIINYNSSNNNNNSQQNKSEVERWNQIKKEIEKKIYFHDSKISDYNKANRKQIEQMKNEMDLKITELLEQIKQNLEPMPQLSPQEKHLCAEAAALIRSSTAIACTACGYCTGSCPKQIAIPDYFRLYNDCAREPGEDWKIAPVYQGLALRSGKASDCISCRQCEQHCPQGIEITKWLKKTAEIFEG